MNILFSVTTIFLVVGCLTLTIFQQDVFAKVPKETDPCKAYKELVKIIRIAGLDAVGTGDEEKMSQVFDFFRQYADQIMELPAPEKGKC